MKIFILDIIKKDYYDKEEYTHISTASEEVCGCGPMRAHSFLELRQIMDQYPNEDFVIFSNFAQSSQTLQRVPQRKDTYEYTAIQFQNICMKYSIKAIHLITGAWQPVVHMELVDLLTRNPPLISYKNIKDFPKNDFQAKRREYIVEKIMQLKTL